MYDLKTASRLYVLEPHHKAVSAVSFAPDGRRLVTVSLEESDATVWKVGSSISGFFNVGGPPRQGGKPGEPYRRIPFVRADDGKFWLRGEAISRVCLAYECGTGNRRGKFWTMTDHQSLSETSAPSATCVSHGLRTGRRASRSELRRSRSKRHNHITYCETSIRHRCREEL